jgi:hypothetical protein
MCNDVAHLRLFTATECIDIAHSGEAGSALSLHMHAVRPLHSMRHGRIECIGGVLPRPYERARQETLAAQGFAVRALGVGAKWAHEYTGGVNHTPTMYTIDAYGLRPCASMEYNGVAHLRHMRM